jgi:hypothetical protein
VESILIRKAFRLLAKLNFWYFLWILACHLYDPITLFWYKSYIRPNWQSSMNDYSAVYQVTWKSPRNFSNLNHSISVHPLIRVGLNVAIIEFYFSMSLTDPLFAVWRPISLPSATVFHSLDWLWHQSTRMWCPPGANSPRASRSS